MQFFLCLNLNLLRVFGGKKVVGKITLVLIRREDEKSISLKYDT